jgi:hypothetical protein
MGVIDEGDYQLHDQDTPHRHNHEWIQNEARLAGASSSDSWTVEGLSWRGRPPRARAEKEKKRPFQWIIRLFKVKER